MDPRSRGRGRQRERGGGLVSAQADPVGPTESLDPSPVMTPDRSEANAVLAGLSRAQLLEIYSYLTLTRSAEERLDILFKQGHVPASVYRSLGQEATAVGTAYALDRRDDGTGDMMSQLIRDLGALFVFGCTPLEYFRNDMAKATGHTRGRETNLHFTDWRRGWVGLISHLGTMVEVMAGVTLTFRFEDAGRVGIVYVGDGATSTGAFHEGLNFAAVQRCPLIVVVEANGYAFSTPTTKQTRAEHFVDKAAGYGIAGERVDGNDVIACYEASLRAAERARAGEGPTLIEVDTFRRLGHAQHDAQGYVSEEELAFWAEKDPIDRFRARLIDNGWATEAELSALEEANERTVTEQAEQAVAEPDPVGEDAVEGIYAHLPSARPWTRVGSPPARRY